MRCEVNGVEPRADPSVPITDKIRIALADDHPIFRDGLCSFFPWRKTSMSSRK